MPADSSVNTSPDASQAEIAQDTADTADTAGTASNAITRRGFLRVAGLTGGGLVAASVAACQVAATPGWSFGAAATPGAHQRPLGVADGGPQRPGGLGFGLAEPQHPGWLDGTRHQRQERRPAVPR
jgi:hypothetical protein